MSNYVDPPEAFVEWVKDRLREPGPLPDPQLGRDPANTSELSEWLSHPSNWVDTELDIVRWDGNVPRISSHHAWKLAPGCRDAKGLIEVIAWVQRQRKSGVSMPEFQMQRESDGEDR
jgi:hypothetical protein